MGGPWCWCGSGGWAGWGGGLGGTAGQVGEGGSWQGEGIVLAGVRDGPGVCGLSSNIYSPKGCLYGRSKEYASKPCRTRKLEKFKILQRKNVIRDRNIVIALTYIGKSCKMLEKKFNGSSGQSARRRQAGGGALRQQPYSAASCSCPAMRASASSSVGSSVSASPSASSRCARLWEPAASTAASVSAASSAATKRGSSG